MQTARTFRPPCPRLCGDPVKRGVIALLLSNVFATLLIGSLFFLALPVSTDAQIVRDSSLGAMKNQPLAGPNYAITPDLGEIQGRNLFQSFSQFNLNTLANGTIESATFSGPATIGNIVTRVTGNQFSVLNGLLQSTIPGANLYVLNPRGVLFGPNASLNVGGAFYVSTADFLRFTDGAKFFTNLSQTSTLSSAPIAAFGFLGPTVAPIVVLSATLQVGTGQTLSLIAGDLQAGNSGIAGGTLRAPSGQVQVASVASAGEVIPVSSPQSPDLILSGFSNLGTINLLPGTFIETTRIAGAGGTVLIRGGRLIVDGSGVFADTQGNVNGAPVGIDIRIAQDIVLKNASQVTSDVAGSGNSGAVNISADSVEISTGARLGSSSFVGSGKPGDITVTAARVLIATEGAIGSSVNSGSSQGSGTVRVMATDNVTIAGPLSQVSSAVVGVGDAGPIFLSAPLVELRDGGSIQSFIFGTGRGGTVEIQGQRVLLSGGGQVVTNSLGGLGGGPVTITATDSITITGQRVSESGTSTSLVSTSTAGVRGDAGAVTLSARSVELSDTGGLQSLTSGQGNAGTITINTARFTVSGGAQVKNTTQSGSSGTGGTINVNASETVTISGQSSQSVRSGLFSDTAGTGNGGSMTIAAPTITVENGALISSSSTGNATGNAGSVTLRGPASPAETLLVNGGSLLTSAEGSGTGGNLVLSGKSITLTDATITATANSGKAGEITLADATTLTATNSALTTESTTGAGGTIAIGTAGAVGLASTAISASVKGGSQPGGDIALSSGQTVQLVNTTIAAESTGVGNAGNISLAAGDSILLTGSAVTAQATLASGGNITLTAPNTIHLTNSTLSTSVQGGVQTVGGNIVIDPQFVILQNSQIIARAVQGAGGNITINTGVFLADYTSLVDASSQFGLSGTVTINSPIQSLSGTLAPLSQAYLAAAGLLRARCSVRAQTSAISSFLVKGRDGLPPAPGTIMPSPYVPLPAAFSPPQPLLKRSEATPLHTAATPICGS